MADAEFDSFVTIGTDGPALTPGALSTVGIDFAGWSETTGISAADGAVFFMVRPSPMRCLRPASRAAPLTTRAPRACVTQDPDHGATVEPVVFLQLTVLTGTRFQGQLSAQGRTVGGGTDWTLVGQQFNERGPIGAAPPPPPPTPVRPPPPPPTPVRPPPPPAVGPGPPPAAGAAPAGWTCVFRQTAGNYMPTDQWVRYNAGAATFPGQDFSILDELDRWRQADGKFTMKIVWPQRSGENSQTWRQTTNPVTATAGGVEGYEAVQVNFNSQGWAGLEHGGSNSLLDGTVDDGNWYYAIGSGNEWGCGIPGAQDCESQVELWVLNGPTPPPAPPPDNFVWRRLMRQTAGNYRPADSWIRYNSGDQSGDFSVLDELESCRQADGDLHMRLEWPQMAGGLPQEWKQINNPARPTVPNSGVEGYVPIDVNYNDHSWGGLEYNGNQALMDGQVNHNNWFYAVGASAEWGGGIPGATDSAVSQTELWALCPPPVLGFLGDGYEPPSGWTLLFRQTAGNYMPADDWRHYNVGTAVQVQRACEGESMTIDCGAETIEVLDSTYGRHHDASVCPHPATSDQACHATESVNIVRSMCQGQASCSIAATNGVFGDPCGGTFKYLTVDYQCSGTDPSETGADFSRLDELEMWRSHVDEKLTMKLVWPRSAAPNSQTWRQTTNPVTSQTWGVQGYESVDDPFDAHGWGGLEHNGNQALLDGTVDHNNWFYAVGSSRAWQGGMPGPGGTAEEQTELWVLWGSDRGTDPVINLDQLPGVTVTAGPNVNDRGNPAAMIDMSHAPDEWTTSPTADLADCSTNVYMTVDLGAIYETIGATIWHYYGNDRAYCNQKLAISTTGRFTGEERVIFDTGACSGWCPFPLDANTCSGDCTPANYEDTESPDGNPFVWKSRPARYIRHWSGRGQNTGVHFMEIDVYGDPTSGSPPAPPPPPAPAPPPWSPPSGGH